MRYLNLMKRNCELLCVFLPQTDAMFYLQHGKHIKYFIFYFHPIFIVLTTDIYMYAIKYKYPWLFL